MKNCLFESVSVIERRLDDKHVVLQIPHLRPTEYKRSRLSRNRRTVNRAYGGVLSGGAVRERYMTNSLFMGVLAINDQIKFVIPLSSFSLQDHSSIPCGRAKDCEEGFEDPKGQGKGCLQELNEWMIIRKAF